MPDTATEAPRQTEALQEPPTVGSAEWYDGQAAQTRALVAGLPLGSKERAELETRAEWEEQRALDRRGLSPNPEPTAHRNADVRAQSASPAATIEITPATAVPFFERREAWLDIADYPGRQVRLWLNVPQSLVNDVSGDDRERRAAALRRMVLAHRVFVDGQDRGPWQDFDQQPLPPPSEQAFWDSIPLDVAVAILRLVSEAPLSLPNFQLGMSNG